MPIGTSDGRQYESQFQYEAGVDEVLQAKDKYGGDRTRGVEPPRDPLSPLFDEKLVTETDIPNLADGGWSKGPDPRLLMQPDKGNVLPQPNAEPYTGIDRQGNPYPRETSKIADFSTIPDDWKNLHSMEWTGNPKELTTLSDHITGLVKGIAKGERNAQGDATGATLLRLRDALQGKSMPPEQIINDLMSVEPLGIPLKGLGNLLRSMGVLGPVEKQINKPISKELHTMSDEQTDSVIAGKQYAMMNTTPMPQMGGLTAEIDKQAGGFSSGPAGTGKRAVESTVSGINPAGGMTKPKKGIDLVKMASDTDFSNNPIHTFKFKNDEGKKGELEIAEMKGGKLLYVDYVGRKGADPYETGPNAFGKADMRDLFQQLRKEFPNAEIIGGNRMSGARKEAGATGGVYIPLKAKHDKELLKELRDKAGEKLARDRETMNDPSLIESRQSRFADPNQPIPRTNPTVDEERWRQIERDIQEANRRNTR